MLKLELSDKLSLKKILQFLATIPGGDISLTALANNLKLTRYKTTFLVELLEKAFLVHSIKPVGRNVLKEPKLLLNLPFRYYLSNQDLTQVLGNLKEDFFVSTLKAKAIEVRYLKTKRGQKTPDFYFKLNQKEYVVEVGGRKKGFSQFKDIQVSNKKLALYPFKAKPNAIPLYAFGLIY